MDLAPSIERYLQQALFDRAYKLAWMDNWPELFGDWSDAERSSIDLDTTWKIIQHRLLHHTGESTPRGGIVSSITPSSNLWSIVDGPITIPFPAYGGSDCSIRHGSMSRSIIAKAAHTAVPQLPTDTPR